MTLKSSQSKKISVNDKKSRPKVTGKDRELFNSILAKKLEKEVKSKPIVLTNKEKVLEFVEEKILSTIKDLREKTNKSISTYDVIATGQDIDAVENAAKKSEIIVSSYEEEGLIIFKSGSVNIK